MNKPVPYLMNLFGNSYTTEQLEKLPDEYSCYQGESVHMPCLLPKQ